MIEIAILTYFVLYPNKRKRNNIGNTNSQISKKGDCGKPFKIDTKLSTGGSKRLSGWFDIQM